MLLHQQNILRSDLFTAIHLPRLLKLQISRVDYMDHRSLHKCYIDHLPLFALQLSVRRNVAGLCAFYKIYHNLRHPLNDNSAPSKRVILTRAAVIAHGF